MGFSVEDKDELKRQLVKCLCGEREIRRIMVFGSFVQSDDPGDMDVAVFQDSGQDYLSLAMKYRRLTRAVARIIPLDIIPLRAEPAGAIFLDEIERGEVVYER